MDERLILWTAYLLMILVFAFTFATKFDDLKSDVAFNQKYLSAEFALLEDIVMTSPGDVVVRYELDDRLSEKFSLGFRECEVLVSNYKEEGSVGESFFCSNDLMLEKELQNIEGVDCFNFEKINNILKAYSCEKQTV